MDGFASLPRFLIVRIVMLIDNPYTLYHFSWTSRRNLSCIQLVNWKEWWRIHYNLWDSERFKSPTESWRKFNFRVYEERMQANISVTPEREDDVLLREDPGRNRRHYDLFHLRDYSTTDVNTASFLYKYLSTKNIESLLAYVCLRKKEREDERQCFTTVVSFIYTKDWKSLLKFGMSEECKCFETCCSGGLAYFFAGKFELALVRLTFESPIDSYLLVYAAETLFVRGLVLRAQGKLTEAESCWRQSLGLTAGGNPWELKTAHIFAFTKDAQDDPVFQQIKLNEKE